ncbi:hypothetical protein IE53DRAFT_288447 [Violaceomyces palustris]|uniref:Uncharacterized protein n=1 Tax=Violaceomyces palustris TaxID=1673888 RepID=A0ACD0NM19_9BASI|nr:hypothetical protein IE53DRAFT_288447 [Violaceomyces palustris]
MAASTYRGAAGGGARAGSGAPAGRASSSNTYAAGPGGRGSSGGGRGGSNLSSGSRWGNGPPPSHSFNVGNRNPSPKPGNVPGPPSQRLPSSTNNNGNNANAAFPSLGNAPPLDESQKLMRDRMLFLLVSLVGNPVTVSVKGGIKYFGILSAANTDTSDLGVVLASAQQLLPKNEDDGKLELGTLKKMLIINGKDLEEISASEVKIGAQEKENREVRERDTFRTDTEISKSHDAVGAGRTLQKWSDDPELSALEPDNNALPAWASDEKGGGLEDSGAKGWDQFAANEARFGIKSDYEETLYTTTLDKSGKDFKERERRAEKLAREIMGASTSNPHIAEERGIVDDSGANEEDKYGAVVRGPGAYVPPAARRAAAAAAAAAAASSTAAVSNTTSAGKANGSASTIPATPAPLSTTVAPAEASPNSTAQPAVPAPPIPTVQVPTPTEEPTVKVTKASPDPNNRKPALPADSSNPLMGDFRQFVSSERERLEKKKAALAKKEKDSRLADLKSWASNFKLKTPMPSDVADVIHKDPKSVANASEKPWDPSLQKSLSPTAAHMAAAGSRDNAPSASSSSTLQAARVSGSVAPSPSGGSGSATANVGPRFAETKAMLANMTIPKIPPFNPERAKARQAAASAAAAAGQGTKGAAEGEKKDGEAKKSEGLASSSSSFKLSAKASTFKPFNPNAAAFTPGSSLPPTSKKTESVATASPAPAPAVPVNPFFGTRVLKRSTSQSPIHIREDFNPWKVSKVPDAKSIGPMWAFTGKPYRQHFVVAGPSAGGLAPLEDGGSGGFPHVVPGPIVGQPHIPVSVPHPGPGGPVHQQPQHIGHPQGHPQQIQAPSGPISGPAPPGQHQPFGMVYQPYAPYRFQGQPQPQGHQQQQQQQHHHHHHQHQQQPQQQHMVQQMQMPPHAGQGGPMPYGGIPPQFMGQQMPFSPPIPPHGAPQGLYSPQMGNMAPPGQHGQFIAPNQHGPGGPHVGGPPPPPTAGQNGPPPPRPAQVPPHMQQKGHPPQPQMFYQPQPGPMTGMPYPPQFMHPGPPGPPGPMAGPGMGPGPMGAHGPNGMGGGGMQGGPGHGPGGRGHQGPPTNPSNPNSQAQTPSLVDSSHSHAGSVANSTAGGNAPSSD